jgi:hypothetical protein
VIDPVELVPPLDWVRFYHLTIPVTFLYPPIGRQWRCGPTSSRQLALQCGAIFPPSSRN